MQTGGGEWLNPGPKQGRAGWGHRLELLFIYSCMHMFIYSLYEYSLIAFSEWDLKLESGETREPGIQGSLTHDRK